MSNRAASAFAVRRLVEPDGDRRALAGVERVVQTVARVARLALDVHLRHQARLARQLEVDVRRAAGILHRPDGAEPVLAVGGGYELPPALEVRIGRGARGIARVVVPPAGVALPDLDPHAGERLAGEIGDRAGEQQDLPARDPALTPSRRRGRCRRRPAAGRDRTALRSGAASRCVPRLARLRATARPRARHRRAQRRASAGAPFAPRATPRCRRAMGSRSVPVPFSCRFSVYSACLLLKYSNRSIDFTRTSRTSAPFETLSGTSTPAAPSAQTLR